MKENCKKEKPILIYLSGLSMDSGLILSPEKYFNAKIIVELRMSKSEVDQIKDKTKLTIKIFKNIIKNRK